MKRFILASLLIGCFFILGDTYAQGQAPRQRTANQDSLIQKQWEEREKYIREGYERELKAYIDKEKGDVELLSRRVTDIQWQTGLIVTVILALFGSLGGLYIKWIKRDALRAAIDDTRAKWHPIADDIKKRQDGQLAELDKLKKDYEAKFEDLMSKLENEALFRQAYQYYDDDKYDEAITLYEKALKKAPSNSDAWFYLGYSYEQVGKIDEEIAAYRKAIELKPNYAAAHNNLGLALGKKGETDEEIKELREAIRFDPDDAEAHSNLGVALKDQGKLEEAIKEWREAIHLKPDYAAAHNNLGNALGKKGETEEAIKEYREAIRLKADYAEAHYNLGITLVKQGKHEEAEKEYREAIRLKPDYTDALENLAVALDDKGERKEARGFWERALKVEKGPEWVERIKKRLAEPD